MGLVGESGCGKTTTGRLILRLVSPDSGQILFHGENILEMVPDVFRQLRPAIQVVFQNPYGALNPRMTVRQLLIEAIQCTKKFNAIGKAELENRAVELLQSVSLRKEDMDRYPHEFSGGQRQRICIARAIATNPELIICDEAVSALDLLVQVQILDLLKNLQKKYSFSYIFISHNLSVVRYMSDRIAVMCMGKIIEEGLTEEIFNNPQHLYTRLLLESAFNATIVGDTEQSYDDKYHEAIKCVLDHSHVRKQISDTHFVLQDI